MAYPTPATSGGGLTGVWAPLGSGRVQSGGRHLFRRDAVDQEANFRSLVGFLPSRSSRLCFLHVSLGPEPSSFLSSWVKKVSCRGILVRRECYQGSAGTAFLRRFSFAAPRCLECAFPGSVRDH